MHSCRRLKISRLHELHVSKLTFVSRNEFVRSKLSNLSDPVSRVSDKNGSVVGAPRSVVHVAISRAASCAEQSTFRR